jgi:TonB family protein
MIKASILLGAAFCLSGLLKRRSAAERHLVWATVIGLAVCLPLLETAVPRWQPDVARRAAAAIPFFSRTGVSRDVLDADDIVVRADSIDAGVGSLTGALTVVWLIGVVAASFATWRAGRLLSRHGRRARRIDDASWRTVLSEVSHAVGARRPVRLLRGDHESVPVTWGWRRPRIVVPASSRDWPADRIRVVLAHELAHIRRRDWIVQLTARAVCVVYWFNPLFWLACGRLNREGEQACDDIVLGMGVDRRDYATHLFEIARSLSSDRTLRPALAMARPSTLERRFAALLDPRSNRKVPTRRLAVGTMLTLLALSLPLAAVTVAGSGATIRFRTAGLPVIPDAAAGSRDLNVVTAIRDVRVGQALSTPAADVVAPEVIEYTTPPLYSDEARSRRIEGTVTLEVHVDATGHAEALRVVNSLGFGLDDNARLAIHHWRFAPAMRNGEAVDSTTNIDIAFSLANEALNELIANDMATRVGPGVTPPRVVRRVALQRDPHARVARTGSVVLDVVLLEDGTPKVVRIVRSLEGELDHDAVRAFEQWRFSPAMKDGRPVKVRMNAEVSFHQN